MQEGGTEEKRLKKERERDSERGDDGVTGFE